MSLWLTHSSAAIHLVSELNMSKSAILDIIRCSSPELILIVSSINPLPPPFKAMMKTQEEQNAPFLLHWNEGEGWPDAPFIVDRIKWNNQPPSPRKQLWRHAKSKTCHFGMHHWNEGEESSKCQDCNLGQNKMEQLTPSPPPL